jgi:hypothetical protein
MPRAFELGLIFSALPEMLMDAWYRQEPDQVREYMGTFARQTIPGVTPPPIKVAIEQAANRDLFWDTPIVPRGLEGKPAPEQFTEYTTRLARWFGERFKVSPARVDHAIRGIFGPVAGDVLDLTDVLGFGLGRGQTEREREASDWAIIGRAFKRGGELGGRTRSVEEFYDVLEEARIQSQSDRVEETEDQRQLRLQMENVAEALTAIGYVHAHTPRLEDRQALAEERIELVREALADWRADTVNRERYTQLRNDLRARRTELEEALGIERQPAKSRRKKKRVPAPIGP